MQEKLNQLIELRNRGKAALKALTDRAQAEKRELTDAEDKRARKVFEDVRTLDALIEHHTSEMVRAGYGNPDVVAVQHAATSGTAWAARAAKALQKMAGETRAIASGSVDVPSLIDPVVTPKTRPARLIDLLVNRQTLTGGNAFEYFRQTVRTNNAAPVADNATKPTSVFTIAPVIDRARVIAHLSEPVPIRLWQDASDVVAWLESEMRAGVLDALEAQTLSGSGSGENLTGILTVAGTTAVAFATDVPTTLRKAVTALQNIGVQPNAWVLNPADAEAIDLTKEGTGGIGYLLDGYTNTNAMSANVFGDNSIQRVISPSVPAGTAVLADWSQTRLYVREDMRLDVDAGGTHFEKNEAVMRAEIRVGLAHLRPASFAIVDLTA